MNNYNPWVCFLYFLAVISFSMFYMHPICLGMSFLASFFYAALLGGRKTLVFFLRVLLPFVLAASIVNPLINHEGEHILAYFADGNPLTLESVIYGFAASIMMCAVICHFTCFNKIMTSDKLMYIAGGFIPSLSLVFSMTLRFVPEFSRRLRKLGETGTAMGFKNGKSLVKGIKRGIRTLSAMISWSLENAIETADSMKSRGFGTGKRTSFSNMIFTRRDAVALAVILVLSAVVLSGGISGHTGFYYFPSVKSVCITKDSAVFFAAYFLLLNLPVFAEVKERFFWIKLKSKI